MNGFTIYKDYYDLITLLTEKEQEEILLSIMRFMFEDIEPILNERQMKVFNNLRRPLEKSKNRGKCGSIVRTNENQNEIEIKSNENQNEIKTKSHQDVIVNVNDDVNVNSLIKEIISYLNNKTQSNFKYTTKATQTKIKTRLNEGYKFDDFIAVIDKKYDEWLGTEFERYLCPETLFGTKFEKYLNQKNISKKKTKGDEQWDFLKGVYDGSIKIN